MDGDFQWVKARSECSIGAVFNRLRLEVEADVALRRELRTEAEVGRVSFSTTSGSDSFTAFIESNQDGRSVIFRRTGKGVSVFDQNATLLLEASAVLSDDKQCRLKVGDQELEFWQFRRRALEQLLFGPSR